MNEQKKSCGICSKITAEECSHVECPNRRMITAQPVGTQVMTAGAVAGCLHGSAIVRMPFYFED